MNQTMNKSYFLHPLLISKEGSTTGITTMSIRSLLNANTAIRISRVRAGYRDIKKEPEVQGDQVT